MTASDRQQLPEIAISATDFGDRTVDVWQLVLRPEGYVASNGRIHAAMLQVLQSVIVAVPNRRP